MLPSSESVFLTAFIHAFCLYLSQATVVPSEEFTHDIVLLPDDEYHLFWKYNDTHITFEVHVQTLGYVGFGLSPTGGMEGADVVIGWVKDGQVSFHVSTLIMFIHLKVYHNRQILIIFCSFSYFPFYLNIKLQI